MIRQVNVSFGWLMNLTFLHIRKGGIQMKKFRFMMVVALGIGLMAFVLSSGFAEAASAKTLKIGNTVPLKTKEGIQIKKWLELLAERLNNAGGLVVKGQKYNVKIISRFIVDFPKCVRCLLICHVSFLGHCCMNLI